ncbi:sigma-54-dependent transcriptional regulator [Sinisalibacter aestuarii]|nr:sigma 54-interacting transcriptional regulator [Sinisalibacter aestuarii]
MKRGVAVEERTRRHPDAGSDGRSREQAHISALLVSDSDEQHPLPDTPFTDAGLHLVRARGLAEANTSYGQIRSQLVVLPLTVDGEDSTPFLSRLLAARPAPVVLVIASNDEINVAAEAMRIGAFDCLFRPFSHTRLSKAVEAALQALPAMPEARLPETAWQSTPQSPERRVLPYPAPPAMPGASASLLTVASEMLAVLERADTLARSDVPVFITGEVGSGKSLIARKLHDDSSRRDAPFITVDCAILTPENIGEQCDLLCPTATGGTLFLDEICALDPAVQPQVLHRITAVTERGAIATRPRVISSTSHDPRAAMRAGLLMSDLFYRLHVAPLAIPPLRDRPDDIALIARNKLSEFSLAEGSRVRAISDPAIELLRAYDWPGNVRELLNVIWSAVAMNEGPQILPEHLPREIVSPAERSGQAATGLGPLIGHTLAEIEKAAIEETIRAQGGSIPLAARVLDVAPSTIYRKRESWARRAKSERR